MKNEKELREKLIIFMKETHPFARMGIIKRAKKYRDIFEYVLEKTKDIQDIPFSTRVYFAISNDYSYRKCALPECNKDIPHNRQVDPINGYESKYCSRSCAQKSEETRKRIEEASLRKYGTRLPQLSKEVREKVSKSKLNKTIEENDIINEKRKKTCLERYGVEYISQNEEVKKKFLQTLKERSEEEKRITQEKIVKTNLKRYGVERPSQLESIKEKIKARNLETLGVEWAMQSEEVRDKSKKTCFEKYGVEHPSQNKDIQKKIHNTIVEKYGVEHYMQLKEIKEKQKLSIRKHYGVDYPLQNEEIKNKVLMTNIKRYGGASPLCSHEIRSKARAKYFYDNLFFDSGAELAYYLWLKDNNVEFEYHPKPISYVDCDGVKRKYFPDFLVEGKLVELKGDLWWENASKEKKETIEKCTSKILFKKDYKQYLEYVREKYGKDFLKEHKKKKHG